MAFGTYVIFLLMVVVLIVISVHTDWNVGTVMYMMWTAAALLLTFINSIVWAGNALDISPAWCQFSSRVG